MKISSGLDVEALCFEENDRLNITEYTQIAMLTAEIAILRAVEEAGIRSQVNAGLSLGEYGALVASGVMTVSYTHLHLPHIYWICQEETGKREETVIQDF